MMKIGGGCGCGCGGVRGEKAFEDLENTHKSHQNIHFIYIRGY